MRMLQPLRKGKGMRNYWHWHNKLCLGFLNIPKGLQFGEQLLRSSLEFMQLLLQLLASQLVLHSDVDFRGLVIKQRCEDVSRYLL